MLLVPLLSRAQEHYNAWSRLTTGIPMSAKVRADVELQYRRQNGYANKDMLANDLMYSVRTWLHYQAGKQVKVSLSPLAWFTQYKTIQHTGDEQVMIGHEWRSSAALELQQRLLPGLRAYNRAAIEFRTFTSDQPNVWRLRDRVGFRYDLSGKVMLGAYNELMLNVAGLPVTHVFDQDRLAVELEVKVSAGLSFTGGYLRVARLPASSGALAHDNDLFLNVLITFAQRRSAAVSPAWR